MHRPAFSTEFALSLASLSITDSDGSEITVTLTLSEPKAGTLSTGTSGSTTSTYQAETGIWTATGTASEINTLLANLVFAPTSGFTANFSIGSRIADVVPPALTQTKELTGPGNDITSMHLGIVNLPASDGYFHLTASGLTIDDHYYLEIYVASINHWKTVSDSSFIATQTTQYLPTLTEGRPTMLIRLAKQEMP